MRVTSAVGDALKRHEHQFHDLAELDLPPETPPSDILQSAQKKQWDILTTDSALADAPFTQKLPFHRTIVQACDNEVLEQIGAIVNSTLLVSFNAALRVRGLARGSLPRHQVILDAIRRRQPNRARAAMSRLVRNTGRAVGKLRS